MENESNHAWKWGWFWSGFPTHSQGSRGDFLEASLDDTKGYLGWCLDGEEEHSSDGALQAWGQRTVSKPTHTESCIANLCTLITAHFSAHPTLHGAHLKVQLHTHCTTRTTVHGCATHCLSYNTICTTWGKNNAKYVHLHNAHHLQWKVRFSAFIL